MRVDLVYFKESGKYYSEGDYESKHEHLFEIIPEVREMFKQGIRPGLYYGHDGFHVLITVKLLPHLLIGVA